MTHRLRPYALAEKHQILALSLRGGSRTMCSRCSMRTAG